MYRRDPGYIYMCKCGRDPGYTLPLTPWWRVVCVQLVAPFAGCMWRDGAVFSRARSWAAYRHVRLRCLFTLAHNTKPWVVCEERRDALLIRAVFLVSGMTVFDYGLDCAHLSPMRDVAFWMLVGYEGSGGVGQGYSLRFDTGKLNRESLKRGA